VIDMNPIAIEQIRSERRARDTAATSSILPHRSAVDSPVAGAAPATARAAISDVSALLSGDRLVVTVAEAGRLLGISRAFAYELAARGELPTIHLGRRVLVPKVALLAMVGLSISQP
jgi:excisionase family DNA binding protein